MTVDTPNKQPRNEDPVSDVQPPKTTPLREIVPTADSEVTGTQNVATAPDTDEELAVTATPEEGAHPESSADVANTPEPQEAATIFGAPQAPVDDTKPTSAKNGTKTPGIPPDAIPAVSTDVPAEADAHAHPLVEAVEPEATAPASHSVDEPDMPVFVPLLPAEQHSDAPEQTAKSSEKAGEPALETEAVVTAPSPAAVPLSLAGRGFNGLAHAGWLVLMLLTVAVTVLNLVTRQLALPVDAHWGAVLQNLNESGNWLFFANGDNVFAHLPPVYIWFLAGLERLSALPALTAYLPVAMVPQAGAAVLLLLCVFSTWLLARGTGYSPRAALSAGLLVLTSLTLSGFTLCAGPGLLFASLLLLSLFFLYRGWIRDCAPLSLLMGFTLAAGATLTLSPQGLAIPLLASLLFLFWRGTFRRAGQRDGAFGFAVMLILVLGWLTWLAITPDAKGYLGAVLQNWRIQDMNTVMTSWWVPFAVLAVLARPWVLMLLVAPWERVYRVPVVFWKARRNAPGSGWIWWSLLGGLALLPFMAGSPVSTALPLLPLLAIAGGKALVELTPGRSRVLFGLMGFLLLALSLLLGAAALLPHVANWVPAGLLTALDASLATIPCVGSRLSPLLPLLSAVQGLALLAGLSFVAALMLLKATNNRQPFGGLLVMVLYVILLVQPVVYLTLPSVLGYLAR